MAIKFYELKKDGPVKTKEQILAEVLRTSRYVPKDMRRSYFYDSSSHGGEQAHYELSVLEEEFDDVPF